MTPTIGSILHYRLSEQDVATSMYRRTTPASIASGAPLNQWPSGAQAHIGNYVAAGEIVPLIVVRVWPNEYGPNIPGVNGQAFLDGNDTLWLISVREGTAPGTWTFPPNLSSVASYDDVRNAGVPVNANGVQK